MNNKHYLPVNPGKKLFKNLVIKIVMFIMGRGMQSASKHDSDIKKEIESFPEGFRIAMKVLPNGSSLTVEKKGNNMKYLGSKNLGADLVINFKNSESAFMVFTAQMGTAKGFAEHRISVKGELSYAMTFTRCINILQGYLFIGIINKRIMKRLPPMPFKKQLIRFVIYFLGIPFGI